MDIHILHNGEQLGPFTEEAVQALLKEGGVLIDDPAWRPGMEEWIPLVKLLYPAASSPAPAAESVGEIAAEPPSEPATGRQKAFLTYMGVAFSPEIMREEASRLVNDTMENPKDAGRLARWNDDRLQLHPELFAAEIQTRRENRAQRFLEICQQEGAPLFQKLTKAHCQVLVGHLDVRSPNWDADEREAAWKHFFPAVAEKFPQLVTEEGKERLKQPAKAKAPVHHAHVPSVPRSSPASSGGRAFFAALRGVVIGLIILGAMWAGPRFTKKGAAHPTTPAATVPPEAKAATDPSKATPAPAEAATPPAADESRSERKPEAPAPSTPGSEPAAPSTPEMKPPSSASNDLPTRGDGPLADSFSALLPSAAEVRAMAIVTKPVSATMQYGKVTIPAGTPVTIIYQNGPRLTVRYMDNVVTIPASSTDVGPVGLADFAAARTTPRSPAP